MKKKLMIITVIVLLILVLCGIVYKNMDRGQVADTNEAFLCPEDYIITEIPIADVENAGKISSEEATKLCAEVLGDKAEENGFPISYRVISAVKTNDKMYYVMHMAWLVQNSHWSYIGNCYVSSNGDEIYDGFVADGEYTMTELRWKKIN